ncbi:hypothetical protein AAMO2058_000116400 [Amorphochlora amoebiformis]
MSHSEEVKNFSANEIFNPPLGTHPRTRTKRENIWRDLITEGGGEEWDSEGVKRGVWRELKSEIQTNFGNNLRNFGEINPIWRKSR